MKLRGLRFIVWFSLVGIAGTPLHATPKDSAAVAKPDKLAVRRLFEHLSDKARMNLRDMTDQCLARVASLPKQAKVEWCEDQMRRKNSMQNYMGGASRVIQMLRDRLAHCSDASTPGSVPDSQVAKDRVRQCEETLNRQISAYQENAANRDSMMQQEAEQCKNNPDSSLETKCRIFQDAFRNYIDRQAED